MSTYEMLPLMDSADRAGIIEELTRKICSFDTAFTEAADTCAERCCESKPVEEMCAQCCIRLQTVVLGLTHGLTWEVWKTGEESELVGIVRLSQIKPGVDALGHYVFFDHDLRGKTELLRDFVEWCFTEHEGWIPLRRLSIEIPDFAFALIRHATRKLGFGGDFTFTMNGRTVPVEGVKRGVLPWRGMWRDLIQLSVLNPNAP